MKDKRTTIEVKGARVHNLKNISLELPREQLIVITGLSGSGKSSLAFDTIYAEGQRRYMESLSSYAKRFIEQVAKPDVDFLFGLSPVISIEQKTIHRNPRSTVGTMTDISNYLNLLFATVSEAYSPYTQQPVPIRNQGQILDALMALPEGSEVELLAPVFSVYGEDFDYLSTEIRKKGYRHVRINGKEYDLGDEVSIEEGGNPVMAVLTDRFTIRTSLEKEMATGIQNALLLGDPWLKIEITGGVDPKEIEAFYQRLGMGKEHLLAGDLTPDFFRFNEPGSACVTCMGLGTYMRVHPDLLVPDQSRSIREGCFIKEAAHFNPDNWHGRHMYSLSQHYGFSLDTPYVELPEEMKGLLLYGSQGEKYTLQMAPEAKAHKDPKARGAWYRMVGKPIAFAGVANQIERNYKWYRQRQVANSGMEEWLKKVMVQHRCPDCEGTRLKASRRQFLLEGKNLYEFSDTNFAELRTFLDTLTPPRNEEAGNQILREIKARLDLLLGIGLDYLHFNRASASLSGGEAQRIRLSTQIGSGLMGMLYVLDEPSIGLHPKDNVKMIHTLNRLRDLGNTVIVVEHDEGTIRAADHVVEMGPGPGIHGGQVVVQGSLETMLRCTDSLTGDYLSGRKFIPVPSQRRSWKWK